MSVNFNIRMDKNLKDRAFPVIESYGLTPAMAVKLFLTQIADTRELPLSFSYKARIPNETTVRALQEAIEARNIPASEEYTLDKAMQVMKEIAGA